MKITAIKQQVRQQGRYSIFVAGKYAFSLSDTALLDSKLVPNQELTELEVRDWQKQSSDDKLYNRALQYVVIRPRSQWEMEQYLQRKNADPLLSQQILSKLIKLNLLDDTAFANSWVASRRMLKPMSRRRLQQELRAKRVSDEVIEDVLAVDETDDLSVLKLVVAKKRQQTRYQDETKLMQYLARQGYQYSDIKQALQPET